MHRYEMIETESRISYVTDSVDSGFPVLTRLPILFLFISRYNIGDFSQVLKVVLNQRITPSLNLQPLSTSKNSWCWGGMNMTEESDEPVLEKLAARFKTEEIANTFRKKVNDCISQLFEGWFRFIF